MEQSQPAVRGQGLLEWYEALISAALVLVLIFSFFFRIIQVDGRSMVPTLTHGDKLIVWAAGYTPQRGDVVIVDSYTSYGRPLVKRVIAKGGDTISIDYAAGLVRVAYHDKDDSVTAPLPMLCTEYNMPQVGDPVMVLHLSNGTEAGLVLGRYWSNNNKPPEGAAGLFRKDLDRTPGKAMIRYDGSTLTIKCAGAINIEAGGAVTINGATIDLN